MGRVVGMCRPRVFVNKYLLTERDLFTNPSPVRGMGEGSQGDLLKVKGYLISGSEGSDSGVKVSEIRRSGQTFSPL